MTDYDFETALRTVTQIRRGRDQATQSQITIADRLATHTTTQFGAEALETVGLALLLAAGVQAELIREGLDNPAVLANLLGFVGEMLFRDARALDDSGREVSV